MKLFTRQGGIALPLIILAALCFRDQLNAVDVIRPSWLVVQAFSFPLGWFAYWLSTWITGIVAPGPGLLAFLFVFVSSSVGAVLNIYLFAACIMCLLKQPGDAGQNSRARVGGDEFRKLLEEHHKHDA